MKSLGKGLCFFVLRKEYFVGDPLCQSHAIMESLFFSRAAKNNNGHSSRKNTHKTLSSANITPRFATQTPFSQQFIAVLNNNNSCLDLSFLIDILGLNCGFDH